MIITNCTMIQVMMRGRKSLGGKCSHLVAAHIPSGCTQTMWLCLCSKTINVARWLQQQITFTTTNKTNNSHNKHSTLNIHPHPAYTQKHCKGSRWPRQQGWCYLGSRYVHIGPSLPSSHLFYKPRCNVTASDVATKQWMTNVVIHRIDPDDSSQ